MNPAMNQESGSLDREPSDDAIGPDFGQIDDLSDELREMANYPGIMAVIREAAKKKGMRFDEADFPDGDIESPNQDIAIFRGSACEFLDRLFECGKYAIAGEPVREGDGADTAQAGEGGHLLGEVGGNGQIHSAVKTG
jgi:hypothetical protein